MLLSARASLYAEEREAVVSVEEYQETPYHPTLGRQITRLPLSKYNNEI